MGEGRRVVAWTTSARDSLDEIFVYRYRLLYQVLPAEVRPWPFFTEPWISRVGCSVVVEPSNRALQRTPEQRPPDGF